MKFSGKLAEVQKETKFPQRRLTKSHFDFLSTISYDSQVSWILEPTNLHIKIDKKYFSVMKVKDLSIVGACSDHN